MPMHVLDYVGCWCGWAGIGVGWRCMEEDASRGGIGHVPDSSL